MNALLTHVAMVFGSVLLFAAGASDLYCYVRKAKAHVREHAGFLRHYPMLISKHCGGKRTRHQITTPVKEVL